MATSLAEETVVFVPPANTFPRDLFRSAAPPCRMRTYVLKIEQSFLQMKRGVESQVGMHRLRRAHCTGTSFKMNCSIACAMHGRPASTFHTFVLPNRVHLFIRLVYECWFCRGLVLLGIDDGDEIVVDTGYY